MFKLGLNVKKESVCDVLNYVIFNNDCSKAEISKACGISVSTVSNVLGFFLDKGLFYKHLIKEDKSAGARSYKYRLDPKYNHIAYALHEDTFSASLIDSGSKLLHRESIGPLTKVDPEQITGFISRFNDRFPLSVLQHRFGYSFSYSHVYDENEIAGLIDRIASTVGNNGKNYPYSERFCYASDLEMVKTCFAKDRTFRCESVLYLKINPSAAFLTVSDRGVCDSDILSVDLSGCKRKDESVERILSATEPFLKERNITRITVDSDVYEHLNGFAAILKRLARESGSVLSDYSDRITVTDISKITLSERGSDLRLKETFADDVIKKIFR